MWSIQFENTFLITPPAALIKISIILIKAVHKGELCFGLEANRQLVAFSALISGYFFYCGSKEAIKAQCLARDNQLLRPKERCFFPNPHSDTEMWKQMHIFKNQFSPPKVRPRELCDKMIKIALRGECVFGSCSAASIFPRGHAWCRDKDSVLQAAVGCLFTCVGAEFDHSASSANTTLARTLPKWNVGACANSETDSFEGAHRGIAISTELCLCLLYHKFTAYN